ncbi:MAG: hypothetical protein CM15mV19_1120 [uncultured marine virus]|nr:MAG: hypothetical protein CM15mV19_1120 [uncultured marine virus]
MDNADRKLEEFNNFIKMKAIYDYVQPPQLTETMAAKKGMKLTPIKRAKKNQKIVML